MDLTTRGYVNILEVSKPGQAPWLEAKLTAEFQVVDDTDWEVTFKDVVGMLRGKQVVKQVFSGVSRVWTHTYLDREGGVRIMRARRPEKRPEDAFLFVLVRRKEREREEGEGR